MMQTLSIISHVLGTSAFCVVVPVCFMCPFASAPVSHSVSSDSRRVVCDSQDVLSVPEDSEKLAKAYIAPEIDLQENIGQPILAIQSEQLPWLLQFWTLLRRAYREQWRRRIAFFITVSQVCIIGVMFSGAFRPLPVTNRRRVACVPFFPATTPQPWTVTSALRRDRVVKNGF